MSGSKLHFIDPAVILKLPTIIRIEREQNGVTRHSNEHSYDVRVYFDDLTLTHTPSPIFSASDYYPFGLTFNSYQRENTTPNKFKFQGQEHIDDLNLGWDSFKWRNHQPDIGRFFNIDPLSEKYVYNSPYAFSENHVVAHRELEGLEKVSVQVTRFEANDTDFRSPEQAITNPSKARNTEFGNVSQYFSKESMTFEVDLKTGEFKITDARDYDKNIVSQAIDAFSGTVNKLDYELDIKIDGSNFNVSGTVDDFGFSLNCNVTEDRIHVKGELSDIPEGDAGVIKMDSGDSSPGASYTVGLKRAGDENSHPKWTPLKYTLDNKGNAIIDKSDDNTVYERTKKQD